MPAGESDLDVFFLPWVTGAGENPYHELLARGLASAGVRVRGGVRRRLFLHEALAGGVPDVVHLHWLDALFLSPRRRLARLRLAVVLRQLESLRRRGAKLVWTAHNLANHTGRHPELDRYGRRRVAALVDAIIAHSPSAARACREAFHVPESTPVAVVPHGSYAGVYGPAVDRATARRELGLPGAPFLFGFVGLLRPHKGAHRLVEAFASLEPAGARLLLAGAAEDDDYRRRLRRLSEDLPGVRIDEGRVPDDRLPVYLGACDAMVFPYDEILTSGAVILAMSYGRPLIAPRHGCFVDDPAREGGLLYDPDDPDGLRRALVTAYADPDAVAGMGERNLRRAEERTWERVGALTREVYDEVLRR